MSERRRGASEAIKTAGCEDAWGRLTSRPSCDWGWRSLHPVHWLYLRRKMQMERCHGVQSSSCLDSDSVLWLSFSALAHPVPLRLPQSSVGAMLLYHLRLTLSDISFSPLSRSLSFPPSLRLTWTSPLSSLRLWGLFPWMPRLWRYPVLTCFPSNFIQRSKPTNSSWNELLMYHLEPSLCVCECVCVCVCVWGLRWGSSLRMSPHYYQEYRHVERSVWRSVNQARFLLWPLSSLENMVWKLCLTKQDFISQAWSLKLRQKPQEAPVFFFFF